MKSYDQIGCREANVKVKDKNKKHCMENRDVENTTCNNQINLRYTEVIKSLF